MIFKLTPEEQQAFDEILQPLLDTKKVNDMKKLIQHGTISTYDHCFEVAKGCLHCNRKQRQCFMIFIYMIGIIRIGASMTGMVIFMRSVPEEMLLDISTWRMKFRKPYIVTCGR